MNLGTLPSTQNTFSVLLDSVCVITALITNCDKSHNCRFWCYFTGTSFRMYISYNDHKRCTKETFLKGSAVYVNLFSVLGSTPSGTIDINLRSCVLNRHNLQQSQIVTSQEFLPSQLVICRNLWPRLCRGKFSQITLNMCSVYLGEYPKSSLTRICEVEYWPIFMLIAIESDSESKYFIDESIPTRVTHQSKHPQSVMHVQFYNQISMIRLLFIANNQTQLLHTPKII